MTDPIQPDPDPNSGTPSSGPPGSGAPGFGPAADPAPVPLERARVDDAVQRRRRDLLPLFYALGFLILAGALFYLYQNPTVPSGIQQEAVRVDTLQQQLQALNDRLAKVEARPAVAPVDLAPLNRQVAALEARPVPAAPNLGPLEARIAAVEARPAPPPPNLAPLDGRIAALEGRPVPPPVNLAPIEERITALEGRPVPPPVNLAPIESRIAAVEARPIPPLVDLAPLTGRVDTLGSRVDALEPRIAAVEQQDKQIAGQLGAVAERSQRISRVQAAMAALEAGQRLGDIPGAPPAVARFAQDAPPTEQALRGSFDKAAAAAQHAEQPAIMDSQSFGGRLWTRAQQAVTVRQGDNVVVGDPLAGVLGRARGLLDAGDLAGAVAAVDTLTGPPAAAMADWAGQAHGLLDARKALSGLAAHS